MSTLLMFILGGVMRWETFISFPMIVVTKVAKWGKNTTREKTAGPQNIKRKISVLSEIVLDCFQNNFPLRNLKSEIASMCFLTRPTSNCDSTTGGQTALL